MDELEEFIEDIHEEPYNFLSNNCVHKHARIIRKARELGHDASFMGCIAVKPFKPAADFPMIGPHFYAEVDGKTVDVSMEPALEQVICKNEDVFRLLPANISKLKPWSPDEGPPLPRGFFPKWLKI